MTSLFLQQFANGLSTGMCYALVALGLTLIFGVLHVLNFVHGELYMVGGLCLAVLSGMLGVPYLLAIPVTCLAVGVLAYGIDALAVRPLLDKPDGASTALLATFAVSLFLHQAAFVTWGPQPMRVSGITGSTTWGAVTFSNQRLFILAAGVLLLIALELLLKKTAFGKAMRALAQNAFAARVVGIDVARVRSGTYVLAALLAGFAGALLTPVLLFSPLMGDNIVIKAFVIVVIGGMGNITGAVVCGLLLGVVEAELSTAMQSEMSSAVIYAALLLTLLFRPQGLMTGRAS